MSKLHMELFFTGFLQVFLVAVNTWQISHEEYVGATIVAFFISFIWTYNVKKIAFGSMSDRVVYSVGAATGTVCGLFTIVQWYGA